MKRNFEDPEQPGLTQLESDLAKLGRQQAEDVSEAGFVRPSAAENQAVVAFQAQMEAAASGSPGWTKRFKPLLAAAAVLATFGLYDLLQPASINVQPIDPDLGVALGEGNPQAQVSRDQDGHVWLDLSIDLPVEYSLDLTFTKVDGELFASAEDVGALPWRFDEERYGALPQSFNLEVQVWADSFDGLKRFGEPLRLGPLHWQP